jgi:hypothetical protein
MSHELPETFSNVEKNFVLYKKHHLLVQVTELFAFLPQEYGFSQRPKLSGSFVPNTQFSQHDVSVPEVLYSLLTCYS